MFFYDSLYFLIMIPVMAISFFVQNKLKSKFKKFSKQPLFANLTGKEVAEKIYIYDPKTSVLVETAQMKENTFENSMLFLGTFEPFRQNTISSDASGKIIKLNKERELKEQLFKQTIDQLKQTFEKNDLDKLQNLYFDFDVEDELDTDLETEIDLEDEQYGQEPTITELVQQ